MPAGALGFEHLDVVPHKVRADGWGGWWVWQMWWWVWRMWWWLRAAAGSVSLCCDTGWHPWPQACPPPCSTTPLSCSLLAPPTNSPPTSPSPNPCQVTEGIPIEYLRHYRSGGYDFGTLAEEEGSGIGGGGFGRPAPARGPGS